jgi:hypothetical protein
MDEAYQGYLVSLLYGFSAVIMWWMALRFIDLISRYGPGRFLGRTKILNSDAMAVAVYYGLRNLAAAILVGLVLSSVRLGF